MHNNIFYEISLGAYLNHSFIQQHGACNISFSENKDNISPILIMYRTLSQLFIFAEKIIYVRALLESAILRYFFVFIQS